MKKLMNQILPLLIMVGFITLVQTTNAQNFKLEHKSGTLEIGEMTGKIYLEAYNGSEILIEGGRMRDIPERARGLKPISGNNDNTKVGLNYKKEGDIVTLRAVRRWHNGDYFIKVPKDVKLRVEVRTSWCSRISVKNFSSDVNITTRHAKVDLENLTGRVSVNSRHGLVKANFGTLNEEIDITARHGGIDITIPEKAKADLSASTRYGEIYSNMDIKSQKRSEGEMASLTRTAEVSASLNGGGKRLRLNARHANIYLRKK